LELRVRFKNNSYLNTKGILSSRNNEKKGLEILKSLKMERNMIPKTFSTRKQKKEKWFCKKFKRKTKS